MSINPEKYRTLRKISLKEMLEMMVQDATTIVLDGDGPYTYCWQDANGALQKIVECDLLGGCFTTEDNDFSTFNQEIIRSNLFVISHGAEERLAFQYSRVDMSPVCGMHYDEYWMAANVKSTMTQEAFAKWFDENCKKCRHMSEICMFGCEPND